MKAMILAAGRGMRMRPLTDHTPKPLLPIAGKPLLAHHLIALAQAGIKEVVINLSYLAKEIQATLGDGKVYGVQIHYSLEPVALETGGGIYQALSLLGNEPFLVLSADIWTHYPYQLLTKKLNGNLAHLVVVDNPPYHLQGDFGLENAKLFNQAEKKFTFANIGVYHPDLFKDCQGGTFPLVKLLRPAIDAGQISGEHYQGEWFNIGTPEEWQKLSEKYDPNLSVL